jgi:Prokaryotic RING finger family 1
VSMQPGKPNFHQSVASQAETGRACPYCRFPLKEGAPIVVCGVCGAPHHADCWHDNSGCAVIACAGGPTAAAAQAGEAGGTPTSAYAAAPVQPHTQPAVTPAPPMWPPQAPPPSSERRSLPLAIAVIVLAVAVGGAAAAIVLSRQSNNNARPVATTIAGHTVTVPAPTPTASVDKSTATTSSPESTTTPTTTPSDGQLPAGSDQQLASEIQPVLLEWHEDVVHRNYHAAWELLSHRKQVQDEREYGYATWVKNQSTLNPYLNPSGLQVSVEKTEANEGVAQVDITGMSWDKPGAPCAEWSGITWVKYEDGAWKYDPGYSTTPQREREWKPRYTELLGGQC